MSSSVSEMSPLARTAPKAMVTETDVTTRRVPST